MTPKRKYLPFIPLFDGGVWTIKERIMVYVYIIMSHPKPACLLPSLCLYVHSTSGDPANERVIPFFKNYTLYDN